MRVNTIYFKTSCIKLYNYVSQSVRSCILFVVMRQANIDKENK